MEGMSSKGSEEFGELTKLTLVENKVVISVPAPVTGDEGWCI